MASYTRQSTFSDGDLITAALFNDEYNQLLSAFENTTGHKHDGTVGEGPVIGILGDAGVVTPLNKILIDTTNDHIEFWIDVSGTSTQQLYIADGAIVPVTDNDIDLGTSSLQFKDLYINGTANIDSLVADTADINGGTIDGTIIGGTSAAAITGTTITGTSFVIGSASIDETELEILDGATLTTTELNYVDGVTSSIQTQIDTKAPLASPSLTGIPTAPTAASNTNTTQIATTAYVQTEITELIAGAPGTLDTLNELAAAINDDANYNTTLTTALATKLPLAGGTMTGDVTYSDNVKAQFGTSNDLQIYHDGSHSYIKENGTGGLYIAGQGNITLTNSAGDETYAQFTSNSSVKLYHDNSIKLVTASTGVDVTGVITTNGLTTTGDINFGDNDKAVFGAGSDLQIYHDGNHSRIVESGGGDMIIQGDEFSLMNVAGTEYMIFADNNSFVKLYYDGSNKLSTTSTGIDVTGTVTSDGLTVDGQSSLNNIVTLTATNPRLRFIESDTTDVNTDMRNSAGDFQIGTINDAIDAVTPRFNIDHATGDISFYEDTGTTAKLFWDASAESLGIGTTSPTSQLNTKGNTGLLVESNGSANYGVYIESNFAETMGAIGALSQADAGRDGASISFNDFGRGIVFKTNEGASNSEAGRILSDGKLLVGKTAASIATAGVELRPNGQLFATQSANYPLLLNRTTSDGAIIQLRKDNTTIGNIGSFSAAGNSYLTIGSGDTGLLVNSISDALQPWNISTNAGRDAAIDLGATSGRFKDLYLSGTANFGSLSDGTITITGFADEDDMSSNSATLLPTQQSVKAYVDSQVSSAGGTGISFADDEKAKFGDGLDLEIYHDGSNSFIKDVGTGDLIIQGSNAIRLRSSTGENMAIFNADGAATLQYDNSTKLQTSSTGIDVTGVITTDGLTTSADINFGDDDKAVFGAGSDLQIYHTSADNSSYIRELGAGNLKILGDNVQILNAAGTENQIFSASDGGVYLYHNGVAKFETTSTGIDVTGTVTSDGIELEENTSIYTQDATLSYYGSTNAVYLNGAGNNGWLRLNASGANNDSVAINLFGTNSGNAITFKTATSEAMRIDSSQNVMVGGTNSRPAEFTHPKGISFRGDIGQIQASTDANIPLLLNRDTSDGTIVDFRKDGTTVGVIGSQNWGIGTSSPNTNLHIYDASGGATLKIESNTANAYDSSKIQLLGGNLSTSEILLGDASSATTGRIIYRHDGNSLAFDVNGSEAARFDSLGNFGIGTNNPAMILDVDGSSAANDIARFSGANSGGLTFRNATANEFIMHTATSDALIFGTNGNTERMRINSSGNVGIGTTSPDSNVQIANNNGSSYRFGYAGTSDVYLDADNIYFRTDTGANTATVTTTGIGIGTTSPDELLHVKKSSGTTMVKTEVNAGSVVGFNIKKTGTTNQEWKIVDGQTVNGRLEIYDVTDSRSVMTFDGDGKVGVGTTSPDKALTISASDSQVRLYDADGTNQFASFQSDNGIAKITSRNNTSHGQIAFQRYNGTTVTESMRLDTSGRLGIGTTSPDMGIHLSSTGTNYLRVTNTTTGVGSDFGTSSTGTEIINRQAAPIRFHTNATERMRIDSSGNVNIATGRLRVALGSDEGSQLNAWSESSGEANLAAYILKFKTGGNNSRTERMRLDSSGNLLVGTTSYNNDNAGIGLGASNFFYATRNGNLVGSFNRLTSDGNILDFRKDGSTVGSIGNQGTRPYFASTNCGIRLGGADLLPATSSGAVSDNVVSLGSSSGRWKDLYLSGQANVGSVLATGNVTAFSDERLKENIETLQGSKVLEMRGVSFTKDGEVSSGVIAQEIEKVAPELVHTAKDEMGTKSVAYGNLVGYLIEAIKDQQKQIDDLKERLDNGTS